ncbi:transposase from transposon Tn916 [Clostridium ragsdalei P11]|uniref:Transposase from transposon Tn916 n=1 Tax=Clostridium ragsdalei P11 TaxID=1353534 RepID=A0A1A6B365_9CLOT|nr:site-specific integrase [Clostridium ragsdalei]OBR96732.1 transposase from transposon Tn916 [Clostridium ragsdalei P11]
MATKTNFISNGKKYYRINYDIGIDADGKRIRKQFVGKSRKEAEKKKLDYINNMNAGLKDTKNMWLAQTLKSWLFEVVKMSGNIKPTTFARYEGLYRNYIENSPIGCMSLDKLESIQIQRYYNKLFRQGKSSNQINYVNKFLKQFLNYAVDCGYILKNPCGGKKIAIPKENSDKVSERHIPVFNNEDLAKIVKAESSKIKYIALFSLSTGMRRGEIIGLKENDIDYKLKEIHIRRTVATTTIFDDNNKRSKQTIVQEPKSKNSKRTIPLPASLVEIVKASIKIKKSEKLKAGSSYCKDNLDYIFLSEQGNLINAGNLDKTWSKFLRSLNIPHKKFHALRHTYTTKQFEHNIPLKTISMLLGHSSIEITANIYTHVLKKEKEKSADILADIKTMV